MSVRKISHKNVNYQCPTAQIRAVTVCMNRAIRLPRAGVHRVQTCRLAYIRSNDWSGSSLGEGRLRIGLIITAFTHGSVCLA